MGSPVNPDQMDWSAYFPAFCSPPISNAAIQGHVEFADVGCGYGGMLGKQDPLLSYCVYALIRRMALPLLEKLIM